jgi:hypothetical protein
MIDYFIQYKNDLKLVLEKAVAHDNIDINMAGLSAIANFVVAAPEE